MAASLSLRVYTGAGQTESASVAGIDLVSADNASNSLANRQANPITVGTNSYEKWVALKIDTAPANNVDNFQIWMDGAVDTSTTLKRRTACETLKIRPTCALPTSSSKAVNRESSAVS